ncbi:hypothetical protein JJE68_01249 [Pediococcus acidilactici]|jgi:hypothetical protein|nr:hypothetical protein JJE68_01249 [Pediococcus acidilactici]
MKALANLYNKISEYKKEPSQLRKVPNPKWELVSDA